MDCVPATAFHLKSSEINPLAIQANKASFLFSFPLSLTPLPPLEPLYFSVYSTFSPLFRFFFFFFTALRYLTANSNHSRYATNPNTITVIPCQENLRRSVLDPSNNNLQVSFSRLESRGNTTRVLRRWKL